MLYNFKMANDVWRVTFVPRDSICLIDRCNEFRMATTDPSTMCIYLSRDLSGNMLRHVLLHELGHCAIYSYNLLGDIHRLTKKRYWVESEEWLCNFIANHSQEVLGIANDILGG